MAENALVRLFGREAATRRRNELSQAFAPKPTPIRDRISAHRAQVDATLGGTTLQNRLAMLGSTGVPVLSDVAGLAADAMGYAGDPSSRTPGNYGLSALGLLPLVPSMASIGQAPKGGIFGINSEWYKGGQFLPSSERTVKGAVKVPKGQRAGSKAEIEPSVWAERPFDGARPLKGPAGDVIDWRGYRESGRARLSDSVAAQSEYHEKTAGIPRDEFLSEAAGFIDAWNNGARWIDADGIPYLADGTPLKR